jgi:hypothetical protein
MAIKNIKKINVRSPYYVNVGNAYQVPVVDPDPVDPDPDPDPVDPFDPVDEIIPPDPDPPTEPVVTTINANCGVTYGLGSATGVEKYRIRMKGSQFGQFSATIGDIKAPMKMRLYNEGAVPGAWFTEGRDEYSSLWLEATGEDDSSLTPSVNGVYPTINKDLTYNYTQSDSDTYGDNLILELLMPLRVLNPTFTFTCQDMVGIESPVVTGYVNVLTIEHRTPATLSQFTVSIDGTNYNLSSNKSTGDGIRLIFDDQTPLIAPESNSFPYPQTGALYKKSHNEWNYSGMTLTHLSHLDFGQLNQEIVVDAPRGEGTLGLAFRIARRPVGVINGVRTLLPSDKGSTVGVWFEHSEYRDKSNVKIIFDTISLKALATQEIYRDGERYVSKLNSLTNQQ